MNLDRVKELSARSDTAVKGFFVDIAEEVQRSLASKIYSRDIHLADLNVGASGIELDHPNMINPTQVDVAVTVHIVAMLESEVYKLGTMNRSGLWSYNFERMIRVTHAMNTETYILREQLKLIEGRAPKDTSDVVQMGKKNAKSGEV